MPVDRLTSVQVRFRQPGTFSVATASDLEEAIVLVVGKPAAK